VYQQRHSLSASLSTDSPAPPHNTHTCRRAARARRLFSKTDVMILRLLLTHEQRVFSSLVFATVAHSAPISLAELIKGSTKRVSRPLDIWPTRVR